MGIDKALLEIDGTPLAVRAASEARAVCDAVSIVGDPARHGSLGFPVLTDRYPGIGPLGGIEAALSATHSDWNLVVACDMPGVAQSLFRTLFDNCESDPASDGAVPVGPEGRAEPLCAVYHRRCHAVILRAIEAGKYKVTDVLLLLALRYVEVADAHVFANLNTPDEFRTYIR